MDPEGIYRRLPVFLQHVACSARGMHVQQTRFGREFKVLLREAEARAAWSTAEVEEYRDHRLRSIISHCARSVPFYKKAFREWNIAPGDIRSLDDLRALPILTKREVQDNHREMLSRDVPRSACVVGHTSGTTGAGLRFVLTKSAIREQWAIWWRYRRWHGIEFGTWCGLFAGRLVVPFTQGEPPFWRYNYPGRQVVFSAYHLSDANLGAYVEEIRRRRLPWLHGYPSILALIAAYIVESGFDLGYDVRWITTGAETLRPEHARAIERAFGVTPRQHYGMAEAVANISECERGSLHVDEDFAAVEFVATDGQPTHRIVGTSLSNWATPFVRYEVGDLVTLDGGSCSCGRPGRIVYRIDGRTDDGVVLKDGRLSLGVVDISFQNMVNVREAQVVQKTPGELIIRIVRSKAYTMNDEKALREDLARRVGDQADVFIEYVDELERSATGKLRMIVSELPRSGAGVPQA
jgi:phenylacetate-CoA ligase